MKPTTPDQLIGKTNLIAKALLALVPELRTNPKAEPIDRCFLLHGPPGTGKTTTAEMFALALAEAPLEIEQRNGQSTSVEVVRDWMQTGIYLPMFGALKVKLIDEIDAMSQAACNEARTWLDKLAGGTVVIATTNKRPQDLEEQLRSRFQTFAFEPVGFQALYPMLKERGLNSDDIAEVIRKSEGNVRAALVNARAITNLRRLAA